MILSSKETCLAYRCPYCGSGVKSLIGVFALSGSIKKLKCDCGASELTVRQLRDGKIEIKTPCVLCGTDHTFTVSEKLFYEKNIFVYACPYSGIDIVFIGSADSVEKELDRSEKELLDILREAGIDDFEKLHGAMDATDEEDHPCDPSLYDTVMFVIHDLMESGEISCCCDDGDYDVAVSDDHVKVFCKSCGAAKDIPTDSALAATVFLETNHLKLEKL